MVIFCHIYDYFEVTVMLWGTDTSRSNLFDLKGQVGFREAERFASRSLKLRARRSMTVVRSSPTLMGLLPRYRSRSVALMCIQTTNVLSC